MSESPLLIWNQQVECVVLTEKPDKVNFYQLPEGQSIATFPFRELAEYPRTFEETDMWLREQGFVQRELTTSEVLLLFVDTCYRAKQLW